VTYWMSRYCAFFVAMLLIESGHFTWDRLLNCSSNCAPPSGIIIQFFVLVLLNSIVVFAFVMIVTSVIRWVLMFIIQLSNGNSGAMSGSLKTGSPPWRINLYTRIKHSVFLRDCFVLTVYLITVTLLVFMPRGSGNSRSFNSHSIVVDGQYTDYGLAQAVDRYFGYCITAFVFIALVRALDYWVLRTRNR
jgi:hypothetical protein